MLRRWLLYLAALTGLIIFYWAYREWFSWLALLGVLCLPVAVLLMSLPAMLSTKLSVQCPAYLSLGDKQKVSFSVKSRLVSPPLSGRVRVKRMTTGETWLLKEGKYLPTKHCGELRCYPEKSRVYDYLGLFFLRVQKKAGVSVVVRPEAQKIDRIPRLERYVSVSWRPKPGGGFAENHDLRLYRQGDSLTQIHWKLSAKTGKYIVREALEPGKSRVLLEMILRGTPEELDSKFGKLMGMSRYLLEQQLSHELRVLTGNGVQCLAVSNQTELETAIDTLLGMPPAPQGEKLESVPASWQYTVGGDGDDA